MKHRSDYKICPFCGATLDVGEKCDCKDCKNSPEQYIKIKPENKGGVAV